MNLSNAEKAMMIEKEHSELSIMDQCEYLSLPRSNYYYSPRGESELNIKLMHIIDEFYTKHPTFGYKKMTSFLNRQGYEINPKRIKRLMQIMGLEAIYPKKYLSQPNLEHKIYPYLLRDVTIEHSNHVWSTDITYIRLCGGFVYLVAVMDWFSRYVLSWELSNSLDTSFCLSALKKALVRGMPIIFNTDQGCQFTSEAFTGELLKHLIQISMDGCGRAFDNIFIERLWRTVKYENVYIKGYSTMSETYQGLSDYFNFYNNIRPHQSLGYQTPAEVYFGKPLIQKII